MRSRERKSFFSRPEAEIDFFLETERKGEGVSET